jgi:hypothetical protein
MFIKLWRAFIRKKPQRDGFITVKTIIGLPVKRKTRKKQVKRKQGFSFLDKMF